MSVELKPGDPAPPFCAEAIGGLYLEPTMVSLKDFLGQTLVLYFYPKDDTPGCTTQACSIRDEWAEVSSSGAVWFGVSVDPIDSHRRFLDKHDLPFALLSDVTGKMVRDYGVWVKKNLYGKVYDGTERTTFVLGADGFILAIFRKVKPAEHTRLVLETLRGTDDPAL
jgi:peroxiredoxin Q/BCP